MFTRCSTLVGLLAFSGLASAALTTGPVTGPVASAEPVPAMSMGLDCVLGFSKDYCNGIVYPGNNIVSGCPIPSNCRTLRIDDATFVIDVFSNNQPCGSAINQTCDESKDGRLKVVSDFTIRLQKHCPYRGCWDGTYAEFQSDDGTVYVGILLGTLGVGTHRPSTTPSPCATSPSTRDCERCYDVTAPAANDTWRIGYEATFKGVAATGEELCFSLSGDFRIFGSLQTGPIWDSQWGVFGTADGVRVTFCQ